MNQAEIQATDKQHDALPLGYRDLVRAFRGIGVPTDRPVVVHSSLRAFGNVQGGAETIAGALIEVFDTLIVPTFTYKTMVIPENGPPDNAVEYGIHADRNKMADFFYPDMPADPLMGAIAEAVRKHPQAGRSGHPVLSFAGVNTREILESQMLVEPFAPLAAVYDWGGWVLLLGVDHIANTSIHLGERLAGRRMYTRWALLSDMVVRCSNFPYCSDGFNAIQPLLEPFVIKKQIGQAQVQAMPMHELIETTRQLIQADTTALLCGRLECPSCQLVRRDARKSRSDGEPGASEEPANG